MGAYKFYCPVCSQHFAAERDMEGELLPCPICGQMLVVPPPLRRPAPQSGATPPEQSPTAPESATTPDVDLFIRQGQPAHRVAEHLAKVRQILPSGEEILYIGVQYKFPLNLCPDSIVLTNRRVVLYRPHLFATADFIDIPWEDIISVRLRPVLITVTVALTVSRKGLVVMKHIPVEQAACVERLAQEHLEAVREARQFENMRQPLPIGVAPPQPRSAIPSASAPRNIRTPYCQRRSYR